MARVSLQPVSSYSPYYGCMIMAAAAMIFLGIVAWSGYTLFTQNSEIDKITVDHPTDFPEVLLDTEAVADLRQRLESFEATTLRKQSAEIDLSLHDLNALVAMAPDLGNGTYRDIVRFIGADTENSVLIGQICLPLNRLKFWEGKLRYLVGEASFRVETTSNGPDLRIVGIQIADGQVPEGFIQSQEIWTWLAPYQKDARLAKLLVEIRSVTVTETGVRLTTSF